MHSEWELCVPQWDSSHVGPGPIGVLLQGRQQKALFSSIAAAATSVLTTGELPHVMLEPVHHKHCALNVTPEQYKVVGEHIVGTIVDLLNPPQEVNPCLFDLMTWTIALFVF